MTGTEIAFLLLGGLYVGGFVHKRVRTRRRVWKGVSDATRRTLVAASTFAGGQQRSTLTAADVVYVALFDPEVVRTISISKADLETIRGAVLHHLSELVVDPTTQRLDLDPSTSALFARAANRASEHRRGNVEPVDLVAVAVGTAGFPDGVMQGHDVRFHDKPAETNATPIDYRGASLQEVQQVIVWDDDATTMEHVLQVLMTHFAKSHIEATLLMLATHDEGAASVGTYPRAEATDRVTRAKAFSDERGMPLKVTVEAPAFRSPPRSWWFKAKTIASRRVRGSRMFE